METCNHDHYYYCPCESPDWKRVIITIVVIAPCESPVLHVQGGMPGMPQMTPEMMKMASEMMSNMTPADIERTARMVQGMPGALLLVTSITMVIIILLQS